MYIACVRLLTCIYIYIYIYTCFYTNTTLSASSNSLNLTSDPDIPLFGKGSSVDKVNPLNSVLETRPQLGITVYTIQTSKAYPGQ